MLSFQTMTDEEAMNAMLIGLRHMALEIQQKVSEVESNLRGKGKPGAKSGKRVMTAAARKRIAVAQKKRWADFRAAREVA